MHTPWALSQFALFIVNLGLVMSTNVFISTLYANTSFETAACLNTP